MAAIKDLPPTDTSIVVKPLKSPHSGKLQPNDREEEAGFFSRLTFTYLSQLVRRAAKQKKLQIEDCWRHDRSPDELYVDFETLWAKELTKPKPSLGRVVWAMSKAEFYSSAGVWTFSQLVQVLLPMFLNQTVRFIEVNNQYGSGSECRASAGSADQHLCSLQIAVAIPICFCICLLIQSLCMAKAQQMSLRIALRFRTVIVTAIFRKTTRLSSIGLGTSSNGQINNLISNDAQQFLQFAPMMHMGWSSPIFIIACFVMLWYSVGAPCLTGIGVIAFILPLVVVCLKKALALRGQMLKFTDERVKLIADVLNGLRVIKAYGLWSAILMVAVFMAPVFNAIGIFTVFAATGGDFTPARVFTALAALNNMRFALIFGPFLLIQYQSFRVSLTRIQLFLMVDELPPDVLNRPTAPAFLEDGQKDVSSAIVCKIEKANASWAVADPAPKGKGKGKGKGMPGFGCFGKKKPKVEESKDDESAEGQGKNLVMVHKNGKDYKTTQVLFDVDFQAEPEQLTAIIGPVGCGKTSLLRCLMGTMEMLSGTSALEGTTAYVAQQAFILNATIKMNITFSDLETLSPEDEAYYKKAVKACALTDDLAQLPGGDLTEIGERGVNLSGGQKQRISLARAVYSRAQVVLLDDPLSAVDAHVGRHLMEQVIGSKGMLAGKTVIFVSHQLQYLAACQKIYMMDDGKITHSGSYEFLTEAGHLDVEQVEESREIARQVSGEKDAKLAVEKKADGVLVMAEEREEGELKWSVLKAYIISGGVGAFWVWLCAIILQQTAELCTQAWLAAWTEGEGMGVKKGQYSTGFFIGIYISLGICQGVFLFFRNIMLTVIHTRKAAQVLHDNMAKAVFRAQMDFFDKNPLGRILNRFTRDMDYIDVMLVQSISQFVNCAAGTVGGLIMICIIYPYFVVVAIVMAAAYQMFTKYFRHVSREIQRLESVTRSPVYSLLAETQAGVATIHGYGISKKIIHIADEAQIINTGIFFIMQSCTCWLQMRLDVLALIVLLCVTLVPTFMPTLIDPGYVGLAIVYAFELNQLMKHMARMGAQVEQQFNAVDRVLDYSNTIEAEAPWQAAGDLKLPAKWPLAGHVRFT
ncbi:unnamed protein product, partial [Polarella glacialis]